MIKNNINKINNRKFGIGVYTKEMFDDDTRISPFRIKYTPKVDVHCVGFDFNKWKLMIRANSEDDRRYIRNEFNSMQQELSSLGDLINRNNCKRSLAIKCGFASIILIPFGLWKLTLLILPILVIYLKNNINTGNEYHNDHIKLKEKNNNNIKILFDKYEIKE